MCAYVDADTCVHKCADAQKLSLTGQNERVYPRNTLTALGLTCYQGSLTIKP